MTEEELRKIQQNAYAAVGLGPKANTLEQTLSNTMSNQPSASGGLLGGLVDKAKAAGNVAGSVAASIASPINNAIAEKKSSDNIANLRSSQNEIAKKYGYADYSALLEDESNSDNQALWDELKNVANAAADTNKQIADDHFNNNVVAQHVQNTKQSQLGADSVKTFNTMLDILAPGVSANPVVNSLQGTIEGAADAYGQSDAVLDLFNPNGQVWNQGNLDWGDVAKSATTGAVVGGVTGLVGKGLDKSVAKAAQTGSKGLLSGIASNSLTRGALTGAVGGSVGGGLSAATQGGSAGDIIGNTIKGGLSGAASGAATGVVMNTAGKVINKVGDKILGNGKSSTVETDDRMYAKSKLAEETTSDKLLKKTREVAEDVDGLQASLDAKARRALNNKTAGELSRSVYEKTGLSSLSTQAEFANEALDIMNGVQKASLGATEDGVPRTVDTRGLIDSLKGRMEKIYSLDERNETKLIDRLTKDLSEADDAIALANSLKSEGFDYLHKANPSQADKDIGNLMVSLGYDLDGAVYETIPQENVRAMIDATASEMRANAKVANANGNKSIGNAWNKMADVVEKTNDISSFRSAKADLVGINEVNRASKFQKNAAIQSASNNLMSGLKKVGNQVGQSVVQPVAATVSNKAQDAITRIGNPQTNFGQAAKTAISNIGGTINPSISEPSSALNSSLYNLAGRSIGLNEANKVTDANNAAVNYANNTAVGLANLSSGASTGGLSSGSGLAANSTAASTTTTNPYAKQLNIIGSALQMALDAGDAAAYVQLLSMYNDTYNNYVSSEKSNSSNLTSTQQNTILGIQNAFSSLQQLEQMFNDAGGGQGLVGGNIANFLAGIDQNAAVSAYNQQAQSLINTIKDAVGKTDSANTQGEVDRLMELIPKITDTQEVANMKINNLYNELQRIYQNTLNNYSGNYSLS